MKNVYKFIGGRKLTFAIVLSIFATLFVFLHKADFDQWSNFMIWIYGSYATMNVGEYFGKSLGIGKEKQDHEG